MSDILARLSAVHDKAEAPADRVAVEVPEYGMTWYFPPLTIARQQRVAKGVNPKDSTAMMVSFLIHVAEDETGARIFDVPLQDKPALVKELHRMKATTLLRIVTESGGGLSPAAASEVSALDGDAMRAALSAVATEDEPILARAIADADEDVLRRVLSDLVQIHEAKDGPKNG